MNQLLFLFITFFSFLAYGKVSHIDTVVDLLKETPVTVHGEFAFKKPLTVYEGSKALIKTKMQFNQNQGIGFTLSEEHISLQTDKGFSVTIAGVEIKVKKIYYDEKTGKFDVKTETPLGLFEKTADKKFGKFLDDLFRPKMIAAFNEIKKLRASKSLNDLNRILETMMKVVIDDKKPKKKFDIPAITGSANLEFYVPKHRDLKFGDLNAEILERDSITLGLDFDRDEKEKLTLKGFRIGSNKGITFSGKVAPEVASFVFKSFNADEKGYRLDYHTGADEIFYIYQLVAKAVSSNGSFLQAVEECDPMQLPLSQIIDRRLKVEFTNVMKLYGSEISKTGVSPALLNQLK